MQSIEARAEYRNSFHCAYRIFTEEGIRAFWAGALPRLSRLMVSQYKHTLLIAMNMSVDEALMHYIDKWWVGIYDVREDHGVI